MSVFFHLQKNKGFSLIEALVAVSIFVFAILVPLRIASQSLLASVSTKDQIIALGLARDGIEYINYWRTINGATGEYWMKDIFTTKGDSMCGSTEGCKVDTSITIGNISANNNVPLRLDPVFGLYGYHASWPVTKYTRVVRVAGIDEWETPQVGVSVESSVSWELTPGFTRTVILKEYLYNWIVEEKR